MIQWKPVNEIARDVNCGKVTAVSLVEKSLDLISKADDFQAIISTIDKRALSRAAEIDEIIKSGKNAGKLAGVPFIAKDNFLVFGSNTTAASNMLKNFDAPYQATVIEKLENEGAICVAKANLDAFAHGASTENSDFFITKNPHDKSRVAGGSSGGSAASIALQLAPFALGTDTGGSIRQPASFCGVVGLKPSYGLVSRSGVIAMASSTDTVGPIASSVLDAASVLDIISGQDPLDSTTIENKSGFNLNGATIKGMKIGVVQELFSDGINEGVKRQIEDSIEILKSAGAEVSQVSIPSLPLSLAVYYIVSSAEISSNLARYDGKRYGLTTKDSVGLDESYGATRQKGFGDEAKRRILIGTYVLSSGYYDAYYKKAQTVRTKIINEINQAFGKVDYLIGPVAPTTAFKVGEKTKDPLAMYLGDIMTAGASVSGIPAISVPVSSTVNLPVGLQVMAAYNRDLELLKFSQAVQELVNG